MSKLSEKRAYWLDIVNEYKAGGKQQHEFCLKAGIKLGTFKYWVGKLKEPKKAERERVAQTPKTFSRVLLGQENASNCYQVKLPNGIQVGVPANFESSGLLKLLGVLC